MWSSSLVASVHYIGFAMALGAVFMRGRYLRSIIADNTNMKTFNNLFIADNLWGVSALILVITGVWRAFGGLEKGSAFYMQNTFFWIKMGLFVLVICLEMAPMIRFIRWRIALKNKKELNLRSLETLRKINDIQFLLVVALPFVASAMARGLAN